MTTAAGTAAPLWRPFAPPHVAGDHGGPLLFVRGRGVWLEAADGRRYLDGVGALEAMAIGHGRGELADVAARQMRELAFLDVFRHDSKPALELAADLVRISPPGLEHVLFTPGGSEAVEIAIKLALQYHWLRGEPSRRRVVCREGAFHGVTFGAMNCDGGYYSTRNDIFLGRERFGAVARGNGGPIAGWGAGARHTAGAEHFAAAIDELGAENVAAIVVDAVATASGVAAPPAADLRELRRLCDEHGIVLVVDEVITGFCRTGSTFASGRYGVEPDLMTVSKALSSGYLPIGATLVADRVASTFEDAGGRDAVFAHGHTYGGHPVTCAVARENIRILEAEGLAERAEAMGERLRSAIATLSGHPAFVDVRGVGMVNGVEVVGDDEAAGSFGRAAEAAAWLRRQLCELGLITLTVHPGTVLLLAPPLVIAEDEVDQLVAILDQGLTDLEARL